MTPGQIHHWFRQQCQRAHVGGPHVTLHGFRHFLVTVLMENGQNRVEDVSQYIGHRSVRTTTD